MMNVHSPKKDKSPWQTGVYSRIFRDERSDEYEKIEDDDIPPLQLRRSTRQKKVNSKYANATFTEYGGAVGKEGSFSKTAKEFSPSFGEWKSEEPQMSNLSGSSSTWGKMILPSEVWNKMDKHNISARVTTPKHWSKRDIDTVQ